MDSNVKIVPKEDYEVLKKYLSSPTGGVILIPEEVLKTLNETQQEKIRDYAEGKNLEDIDYYDFGGEPDVSVEMVLSNTHNFLGYIEENMGDEDEYDEDY